MIDQRRETRGRKPKLYPYQGRLLSLSELAEISGEQVETLRKRIIGGMTAEEAAHNDVYRRTYAGPKKYLALHVIYKGQRRTLEEWADLNWMKKRKINKTKLYARLFQLGWTPEEAFGDAPRSRPGTRSITIETPDGPVTKTMTEWSKVRRIPLPTISRRLSRGWTDAQALEYEPSPRELRDAEHAESEDDVNG